MFVGDCYWVAALWQRAGAVITTVNADAGAAKCPASGRPDRWPWRFPERTTRESKLG